MTASVGAISGSIELDASSLTSAARSADRSLEGLEDATDEAESEVDSLSSSTDKAGSSLISMKGAVTAAGAAAAGVAAAGIAAVTAGVVGLGAAAVKTTSELVSMSDEFSASADELAKNARRIGLGVEKLDQWRFVAERSGIATQKMDDSLKKLNKRFGEAKLGTGRLSTLAEDIPAVQQALEESSSASEFITELSSRFGQLENQSQRAAVAQAAFGRGGKNLISILQMESGELEALRQRHEELGSVTEKTTGRAEAYQDALGNLGQIVKSVKSSIAGALLPSMTLVIQTTTELIDTSRQIVGALSDQESSTTSLSESLFQLTQRGLVVAVEGLVRFSEQVESAARSALPFADTIAATLNTLVDLHKAQQAASKAFDAIKSKVLELGGTALANLVRGIEETIGGLQSLAQAAGRSGLARSMASAQSQAEMARVRIQKFAAEARSNATSALTDFSSKLDEIGDREFSTDDIRESLQSVADGAGTAEEKLRKLQTLVRNKKFEDVAPDVGEEVPEEAPGGVGGGAAGEGEGEGKGKKKAPESVRTSRLRRAGRMAPSGASPDSLRGFRQEAAREKAQKAASKARKEALEKASTQAGRASEAISTVGDALELIPGISDKASSAIEAVTSSLSTLTQGASTVASKAASGDFIGAALAGVSAIVDTAAKAAQSTGAGSESEGEGLDDRSARRDFADLLAKRNAEELNRIIRTASTQLIIDQRGSSADRAGGQSVDLSGDQVRDLVDQVLREVELSG